MFCLLTAFTVPHSVTFLKISISSIVNLLLLNMYESASSDSSVNPCVLNTSQCDRICCNCTLKSIYHTKGIISDFSYLGILFYQLKTFFSQCDLIICQGSLWYEQSGSCELIHYLMTSPVQIHTLFQLSCCPS